MTLYDDRPKVTERRQDAHAPVRPVIRVEDGTVPADDGRPLAVTWFHPASAPVGAVLVAGAMATRRRFYAAFGRWLAEQGFLAMTVDYRGMESPAALRAERGDALRWTGDAASALEALVERAGPDVPVTWVGHSLGGQAIAFARHDLVSSVVLVSAGSGYWRLNQPAMRWRAPFFWRVLSPLAVRVAGYYPGRRLGVLGDLPRNVMAQWARWCLHPEYAAVDVPTFPARFGTVTAAVTAISMTDDELLSGASMDALERLFTAAPLTRVRLSPADLGVAQVGHHGFLREGHRSDWDAMVRPALASARSRESAGA